MDVAKRSVEVEKLPSLERSFSRARLNKTKGVEKVNQAGHAFYDRLSLGSGRRRALLIQQLIVRSVPQHAPNVTSHALLLYPHL